MRAITLGVGQLEPLQCHMRWRANYPHGYLPQRSWGAGRKGRLRITTFAFEYFCLQHWAMPGSHLAGTAFTHR